MAFSRMFVYESIFCCNAAKIFDGNRLKIKATISFR